MKSIYEFLKKHWIFYSVIIYSSSLVGIFMKILNFNNLISWLVIAVLSAVGLLIVLLNNYNSNFYHEDQRKHYNQVSKQNDLFAVLSSSLTLAYDNSYNHLLSQIEKNSFKTTPSDIIIFSPETQIKTILKAVIECFSELCNMRQDKLIVGIIYNLTAIDDNWYWIRGVNAHTSITLNELLNNPRTASYPILTGQKNFVFYNDKKIGIDEGHYVPDTDDTTNRNIGSIVIQHVTVKTADKLYARAILCVNTYGQKFTDESSYENELKRNIETVIFPEFIKHLQIELAILYIQTAIKLKS